MENILIGKTPLSLASRPVSGGFVELEKETFYKISNYDQMPPFFMSIVSPSDHWMFISSNGGLTAGRKNAEYALFPYATDDKITDSADITGSKTMMLVHQDDQKLLWEPFSNSFTGAYQIERNIYKNKLGNTLLFEEINHDLGIQFRYAWQFSEQFGFVKTATLSNLGSISRQIDLLDGIQNILPYGVGSNLQNIRSNLVDAYKKSELDEETGLGMYMLSAIIVDKAEPSEALRASTVWQAGIESPTILLSSTQIPAFRSGQRLSAETDVRARRGAYFINSQLELAPAQTQEWVIVAEISRDASDVAGLRAFLSAGKATILSALRQDLVTGGHKLTELVGMADGLQLSQDTLTEWRHFSNVLFNIMRGGIFEEQYQVQAEDFRKFLLQANRPLASKYAALLQDLPAEASYQDLMAKLSTVGDMDLLRLGYEYLPLTFSRRHGDPSRPWNRFSIELKNEDGGKNRNFEGNWRDIFQNWEALAMSFPGFVESMIAKFVNASTIDGYNPYRITRNGIDWEVVEPHDPWSFIGYWGDHQIIYLLKLLELSAQYHPEALGELLSKQAFVYANVPYRIKGYDDIVKDPSSTVDYDNKLESVIDQRVSATGSDGKLVWDGQGGMLRVNLVEKLLVTLLAKLSNFIPEAGIWLNTQRPEWNDANNALVGNGVSMVTLYYMRRYLSFFSQLMSGQEGAFELSNEVRELLTQIHGIFEANSSHLSGEFSREARRQIVDALGLAGESYRGAAYKGFAGERSSISKEELLDFFALTGQYLDHSIRMNKREDGLYHAYNLVSFEEGSCTIDYLYEMLEGQVAVLSAGILEPEEVIEVLAALKHSAMYREEHYSYMLYPDRRLPSFLEKNNIPSEFATRSPLFNRLVRDGNTRLVTCDVNGHFHFNGDFNNAGSVAEALTALAGHGYAELVKQEGEAVLEVFEQMFNHHAFTGRSGTFFGYEGLGSIYWHMVSKLVLAISENYTWAQEKGASQEVLSTMVDYYYETRAGIGLNKSPELYGAFPTDPYSHTPGHSGARQPGMTGQVKEDIISRWRELGLHVEQGCLSFAPSLLRKEEFLTSPAAFEYRATTGQPETLALPVGALAFTCCQTPVQYVLGQESSIRLKWKDGKETKISGLTLPMEQSKMIFDRSGDIVEINVELAGLEL
ncbi:MAG: hypothetical protein NWR72_01300 [Bacteroidia bacterium]|nr:hypothetical protein [Bacteroidia bacterium]